VYERICDTIELLDTDVDCDKYSKGDKHMPKELDDIKATLVRISKGDSILDTLMEFERTLDTAEVFAYQNWMLGEIVDGPHIDRYWYRVTLMYPLAKMPDPDGGLRLTKLGAKVNFRKSIFKRPVKVHGPQDWRNASTKKAKIAEHPVWLISIDLPIKYINRGRDNLDDMIAKDLESANDDLGNSYEEAAPPVDTQSEDTMPPVDDLSDQGEE